MAEKHYSLDPRHQRFIDELLLDPDKDGNQTNAAIRAGVSPRSAKQMASRWLKREDVQAELARRRAKVEEAVEIGQIDIVRGLHKEATLEGDGSTQAGRVSAWMGIAKVLGYGAEKVKHVGDPDNPIVHEVRRTIVDPKSDGAGR